MRIDENERWWLQPNGYIQVATNACITPFMLLLVFPVVVLKQVGKIPVLCSGNHPNAFMEKPSMFLSLWYFLSAAES